MIYYRKWILLDTFEEYWLFWCVCFLSQLTWLYPNFKFCFSAGGKYQVSSFNLKKAAWSLTLTYLVWGLTRDLNSLSILEFPFSGSLLSRLKTIKMEILFSVIPFFSLSDSSYFNFFVFSGILRNNLFRVCNCHLCDHRLVLRELSDQD